MANFFAASVNMFVFGWVLAGVWRNNLSTREIGVCILAMALSSGIAWLSSTSVPELFIEPSHNGGPGQP